MSQTELCLRPCSRFSYLQVTFLKITLAHVRIRQHVPTHTLLCTDTSLESFSLKNHCLYFRAFEHQGVDKYRLTFVALGFILFCTFNLLFVGDFDQHSSNPFGRTYTHIFRIPFLSFNFIFHNYNFFGGKCQGKYSNTSNDYFSSRRARWD